MYAASMLYTGMSSRTTRKSMGWATPLRSILRLTGVPLGPRRIFITLEFGRFTPEIIESSACMSRSPGSMPTFSEGPPDVV